MEVFRNAQWLVTDEAVERADGKSKYQFIISRSDETETHRADHELYSWPPHMAEKTWVDVGLFNEAFEHALRLSAEKSGKLVDEDMLSRSYAEAHIIAGRRSGR